jgi:hypothetical protein
MQLLQISMIDYELANNRRCLHAQSNHTDIPYNAFTPSHYKELRQYLVLLLIRTNIITNSKCTKSPTNSVNLNAIDTITKNYH